jgi:DNA-binding GntR family transcriptional regulator
VKTANGHSQMKMTEISRPKSLTDQAYHHLKAAIRSGALEQHYFYPLGEVAAEFGISRTPVREAVLKLAHEGLLEILPQRGFRIREVAPEEAAEVFELRNLLEGRTVEKLARKARADDLRKLRAILARQQRLVNEPRRFLDVDEEFHLTMLELAGFRRAREFIVMLRDVIWLLGIKALSAPGRLEGVLSEHSQIVDCIARKDPAAARRAVSAHLDSTYRTIEQGPPAKANRTDHNG